MLFLVEQHLKVVPTPDILALIPSETARDQALDAAGVRLHLFIAADQSQAWQIYRAASLADLHEILATFPLYPYVNVTIPSCWRAARRR